MAGRLGGWKRNVKRGGEGWQGVMSVTGVANGELEGE